MAIEDALAPWLGNQRWFAGKGQGLRDLAIVSDTKLAAGDPELRHLIIAVSHGAAVDYYQILVGLRRRQEIGRWKLKKGRRINQRDQCVAAAVPSKFRLPLLQSG